MLIGGSFGGILEMRDRDEGGLALAGQTLGVEAAWLVPSGSTYLLELGASALLSMRPRPADEVRLRSLVAGFGGVRINLLDDPSAPWMPIFRGGIEVGVATRRAGEREGGDARLWLGPRASFALERELWLGTALSVGAEAHAAIAPLAAVLCIGAGLTTQAVP